MTALRLLSWNVGSLRGERAAMVRGIRDAAPDVVCLQGAPSWARWRSKRARLARESGLVVVTGPRASGVALFCAIRVAVRATRAVALSPTPGRRQCGLALATLELATARVTVGSFVLGLDTVERLRHLPEVARALEGFAGVPAVLAGEVAEASDEPVYRALAARFRPVGVAGSGGSGQRVTGSPGATPALFVDAAVAVREVSVLDAARTPGRERSPALLAVLELRAASEARDPDRLR